MKTTTNQQITALFALAALAALLLVATDDAEAGGMGGHGGHGTAQNTYAPSNAQAYGASNVSGVGNTQLNYPRQTPMAYAPGSYSANPCIMNYSAGGSGAPFGFSVSVSAESDECNARADSVRWQELGMAKVACTRMLVDSDENNEALKSAGLTCADIDRVSVAVPAVGNPAVSTPALDAYRPGSVCGDGCVTHQELDNAFKKAVGK